MIILGIDPGTSRIGFAFLEKQSNGINLLECGCLELAKKRSQAERLKAINDEIGRLINKHRPEAAAVEKLFFSKNTKTALSVAEARGVLLNICAQNGLDIMEFAPTEVKLALTGYGRAEKSQVQKMVLRVLKLENLKGPDDIADAIAVGLTACYTNKNLKKNKLMIKEIIISNRNDDDYTGHDKDGSGDGADNLDSWDDDLKEEEKKEDELGGLDDAETTDDEEGNY